MKNPVSAAIAAGTFLLVLIAYFIDLPVLDSLSAILLTWAMDLAAVALFVGTISLLLVHVTKIRTKQKNSIYSVVVLISLLTALFIGLLLGPGNEITEWIFTSIQLPIEKSLMALLVVTMTYASIRLLRRRPNLLSLVFIFTGLLVLMGSAPLPFGEIPFVGDLIRPFIMQVPSMAGARGILLGVALGTLTTGLRILFAADRPYGGNHG